MWVFGYGSLTWKVDFNYEKKLCGFIKGYARRFYQHSIDHRGTPERPGRVVTLVKCFDPNSAVWGVAYKIKPEDIEYVTNHLDYREKNGYTKKSILFFPQLHNHVEPFELTLYIATEDNESYAGPAPILDLARQIVRCGGSSGPNKDYVYNLAAAMRRLAPQINDTHLFALENAVRVLDN